MQRDSKRPLIFTTDPSASRDAGLGDRDRGSFAGLVLLLRLASPSGLKKSLADRGQAPGAWPGDRHLTAPVAEA